MFNKQGMVFDVASAMLTNGRYPCIYSSAVVKQGAFNRFTNCHTYYLFISGQKLKTYQSSDWKNIDKTHSLTEPSDKIQFHENYFFKKKGGGGTLERGGDRPLSPPPLNPPSSPVGMK